MNEEFVLELMDISDLEMRAYYLVEKLFSDKVDKSGRPYVEHLIRVRDKFHDANLRIVALLHDVLEDTHLSGSDLKRLGFSKKIIEILGLLTRNESITYHDYITRIIDSDNSYALKIKLADMRDNMDEERLSLLEEKLQNRLRKKYGSEIDRLEEKEKEIKLC